MITERDALLMEIHHRVKNNLQLIESLLCIQADKVKDTRYLNLFSSYTRRIHAIARIEDSLYHEDYLDKIDFKNYVVNMVRHLRNNLVDHERYDITIKCNIDPISLNINKAIPCALIINEIISNSLIHAFTGDEQGLITIKITADSNNERFNLEMQDNGTGLAETINIDEPTTMGLEMIRVLVRQLNGVISLRIENGTRYVITFPA
ncbi:MAG TPA: histidine kinase dimerization/phosphoacceptor domain -containing protein [Spirochaetota bacterium]|nr:histidine kinase dimerization/phosphoacceptor domain -containing protein [Spirochaetota bacterium]HPI91234.1 histidine kinase dimerization/phosphoacceptor domain -containing protein [Spirochaetota bacterium]HPR50089.1 histidine kinase dimerization/phosphoacceptor domain -containing protein [Spirochaetota bacterium]